MASLNLKGVPERLYAKIKKSARENRRSLNNEAIYRLEQAYGLRATERVVPPASRRHPG